MKTSTKIGLGLSIATVAGVYVAVSLSEKVIKKVEHGRTRCKAKQMVNEKFNGNEKLLDVVDNLSDSELDSIGQVVKEIKDGREKVSTLGEKIKSNTEKFLEEL
ncbi:hypothetical protein DOK76_00565 [Vagococcus sp. DIV0080]|uniref:YtxH domain-containing protein n=1 Tax=Candidatus Vagococcus giribetii TaxID=2230876 RepID=A0ABS3HP67_9ENTE|nr:hypothetical protein [Vagococcus sp. DIV0080]MBO0475538.1 hypothetical protein [Vagococcus sp. DIV0080]